jgi:CheY-specific phosphatase CheX
MDDHDLSNPALRAACRQAVLEVLETMFFEVPLDEDLPSPAHEPEALIAKARFDGGLEGWLCVAISPSCAGPLAAAFLGIDEEDAGDEERRSILIELTNIVCGATLSRLDPSGRLHIHQPVLVESSHLCQSPWLRFPLACGTFDTALRIGVPS